MVFSRLQREVARTLLVAACLCAHGAMAWARDRKPVPDAAAQARAQKLVRDVYGKEYDAAETSKEKTELAEKLLDQATKSKGDPAGHFVLLRVAKDVSVLAGDAKTALEAVDRIVATYDVDAIATRLDCVKRLAAAAKLSSQYGALAEQAESLIDVALADDDFETASQFGEIAQELARRARNYSLLKEIVARIKRCEELQQAHAEYRKAIVRLEENPTDPEANLTAGRYLSLSKGDWERGIPLLALGSDAALKAAATQELAGPTDPVAQIELADTWYELGESAEKETKTALLRHAGSWYKRAEPNVTTALQKAKLTQRLEEIEKLERSRSPVAPGTADRPQHARPNRRRPGSGIDPGLADSAVVLFTFERSTYEERDGKKFAKDLSKNHQVGEFRGQTQLVPGRAGDGIRFLDTEDRVTVRGEFPVGNAPRTLSAWFKLERPVEGFVVKTGRGREGAARVAFDLRIHKKVWSLHFYNTEVPSRVHPDGNWHHHCIVFDGNVVNYLIDTVLVARRPVTLQTLAGEMTLGSVPGVLDEVVLFDRALNVEEVQNLFQLGRDGHPLKRMDSTAPSGDIPAGGPG
jgi:hypothetical protein